MPNQLLTPQKNKTKSNPLFLIPPKKYLDKIQSHYCQPQSQSRRDQPEADYNDDIHHMKVG
jgi:hypothetical protein